MKTPDAASAPVWSAGASALRSHHRVTCWACGKKIKPDKAPRALCPDCACGGYLGGS